MTQIDLKTGDVFEVTLPKDLGYAWVKGINLLELNAEARYPTLVHVYNCRGQGQEHDLKDIVGKGLILGPQLIGGIKPAISSGDWRFVGNFAASIEEKQIPHFKKAEPDEVRARDWYYIIDADISKKVKTVYDKVSHLETIGAIGSDLFATKIAMAFLKEEGKRIEDYFALEEYFEKEFFRQIVSIPAYHKLPDSMKGRAL